MGRAGFVITCQYRTTGHSTMTLSAIAAGTLCDRPEVLPTGNAAVSRGINAKHAPKSAAYGTLHEVQNSCDSRPEQAVLITAAEKDLAGFALRIEHRLSERSFTASARPRRH